MTSDQLPEPWREWYEERAAIREHDGGMTRPEAEAAALAEVVWEMSRTSADLPDTTWE